MVHTYLWTGMRRVGILWAIAAALCALSAPAAAAGEVRPTDPRAKGARAEARAPAARALGSFTPATGDAVGATVRTGSVPELKSFRFTPSGQVSPEAGITVGTRSRTLAAPDSRRGADEAAGYDVGVAVAARGLAVTGTSSKVDLGIATRESVGVGLGYGRKEWSAMLSLAEEAERLRGPDSLGTDRRYSIELGGAYTLTRNLKLGAGVRYRVAPEDRADAQARAEDDRAAYLGLGVSF